MSRLARFDRVGESTYQTCGDAPRYRIRPTAGAACARQYLGATSRRSVQLPRGIGLGTMLHSGNHCIGTTSGGHMYRYDVFVSYKREPTDRHLVTPWLKAVLARTEFWLKQELGGREISVFFDEDSIDVGTKWPDEIRDALLASRCLLAIWSPEYFHSAWCMAEWRSFVARENMVAADSGASCVLIFPVKFHDGRWYPQEARETQQFDLSDYAATTSAFWQSQRADDLDRLIRKRLAPALARSVADAPDHKDGWPVEVHNGTNAPTNVGMVKL